MKKGGGFDTGIKNNINNGNILHSFFFFLNIYSDIYTAHEMHTIPISTQCKTKAKNKQPKKQILNKVAI